MLDMQAPVPDSALGNTLGGLAPPGPPHIRFLFVGERPSRRALRIGATWQNGKLAGKTLRESLRAAGVDPEAQRFLNLYRYAEPSRFDPVREAAVCRAITRFIRRGFRVVALGKLVSRRLRLHGLAHLTMIHPAARGPGRRRDLYHAHVAETLAQAHQEDHPCAE